MMNTQPRTWLVAGVGLLLADCQTPPAAREPVVQARPQIEQPAPEPEVQVDGLHPLVSVETSLGAFVLQLDAKAAPATVINFLDYVEADYYAGTTFHRVTGNVIQGGAYTPDMQLKTTGLGEPIQSEWPTGIANRTYTIGMVRQPGDPASARAEFYINIRNNVYLDEPGDGAGYTVFGEVVEGRDVIDGIAQVPVSTHPDYAEGLSAVVPLKPVVIRSTQRTTDFDRPAAEAIALEREQAERNELENLIETLEAEHDTKAVRRDSGLIYVDIEEGRGGVPVLESTVSILYETTTLDGLPVGAAIDEPLEMTVESAVPGMQEALLSMKEGGRRIAIVPPELAYGASGVPGMVPPDAILIYEIELLSVR